MAVTAWLIDKSALVRLAYSDDAEEWASRSSGAWCGSDGGRELAQLTVLHFDQDYELIADITGQPVDRLGPI